jgi:hypothetical protein
MRLYVDACTSQNLVLDSPLRLDNTPPETVCFRRPYTGTCTLDHPVCTVYVCTQIFSSLQTTSVANEMPDIPKKVGWIGLGIMGLPMSRNLLGRMDNETQFYVYDVVQKSIDDFVEEGQGRVHACSSSKEVADLSVCYTNSNLFRFPKTTYLLTGSRTLSSQWSPKAPTSNPST